MKKSTKDLAQGKFHEVKGKVKEATGEAFNKPDLAIKGQTEKIAGKIQSKVGEAEKSVHKKSSRKSGI